MQKVKEQNVSSYYYVDDVKARLGCSESKAYKIIKALNEELREKGYIVISGRIPIRYFNEKYYI